MNIINQVTKKFNQTNENKTQLTLFSSFQISISHSFRNKSPITNQVSYIKRTFPIRGLLDHIAAGKAWSPAQWTNERKEENFLTGQLLVLDLDEKTTPEVIEHPLIKTYACLVHNSASNTGSRVVFALDQAVTDVQTYKTILAKVHSIFAELKPDPACKDATRQYYGSTWATGNGVYLNESAQMLSVNFLLSLELETEKPAQRLAIKRPVTTIAETFNALKREITQQLGVSGGDMSRYEFCKCPMTEHEHDHQKPRAQWDETTGVLHCFKCGTHNTLAVADALGIALKPVAKETKQRVIAVLVGDTISYDPNIAMHCHRSKQFHLLQAYEVLHLHSFDSVAAAVAVLESVGIKRKHRTYLQWFKEGNGLFWNYSGYTGTLELIEPEHVYSTIYNEALLDETPVKFSHGNTSTIAEITRYNSPGSTTRIHAPIVNEPEHFLTVALSVWFSAYNGLKISQARLRAMFGIGSNTTLQHALNQAIENNWITKQGSQLQFPLIEGDKVITKSANHYTGKLARVDGSYTLPANIEHIHRYYVESEHKVKPGSFSHQEYQVTYLFGSPVYRRVSAQTQSNCTPNFSKAPFFDTAIGFSPDNLNPPQPALFDLEHWFSETKANQIATQTTKQPAIAAYDPFVSITSDGSLTWTTDNGQTWWTITEPERYTWQQLNQVNSYIRKTTYEIALKKRA